MEALHRLHDPHQQRRDRGPRPRPARARRGCTGKVIVDLPLHHAAAFKQERRALRLAAVFQLLGLRGNQRQRGAQIVREIARFRARSRDQLRLPLQQRVESGDDRLELGRDMRVQPLDLAVAQPVHLLTQPANRRQAESHQQRRPAQQQQADHRHRQRQVEPEMVHLFLQQVLRRGDGDGQWLPVPQHARAALEHLFLRASPPAMPRLIRGGDQPQPVGERGRQRAPPRPVNLPVQSRSPDVELRIRQRLSHHRAPLRIEVDQRHQLAQMVIQLGLETVGGVAAIQISDEQPGQQHRQNHAQRRPDDQPQPQAVVQWLAHAANR